MTSMSYREEGGGFRYFWNVLVNGSVGSAVIEIKIPTSFLFPDIGM